MTIAALVSVNMSGASLLWWLIVGFVAGLLASIVMRGGFGLIGDILAGIVGAFIGGWLFGVLGISLGGGIIGSIFVAFIGACVLIAILHALAPRRTSRRYRRY